VWHDAFDVESRLDIAVAGGDICPVDSHHRSLGLNGPMGLALCPMRRMTMSNGPRQKIDEFAPGRLAALGPEMRKLAEERLQQINLAFDAAERQFTGQ
jgi:hypothetical protein